MREINLSCYCAKINAREKKFALRENQKNKTENSIDDYGADDEQDKVFDLVILDKVFDLVIFDLVVDNTVFWCTISPSFKRIFPLV